jgi:hypothetical protein
VLCGEAGEARVIQKSAISLFSVRTLVLRGTCEASTVRLTIKKMMCACGRVYASEGAARLDFKNGEAPEGRCRVVVQRILRTTRVF